MYTINQPLPGATRSWLPCIDRIHDRCTWDMDFIVPNKLGSLPNSKNGEDMTDDEYPSMVVCSGEMVEQVNYYNNSNDKRRIKIKKREGLWGKGGNRLYKSDLLL